MWSFLQGLALQASLIIVVGPQNAFIIRQGLSRTHVVTVCAVAALCDTALIGIGTAGFGTLVEAAPVFVTIVTWGGIAFLGTYAAMAGWRAIRPDVLAAAPTVTEGRRAAILGVLAFSLLNPHVYLDTVVLIGGLAARQPEPIDRAAFAAGAATLSALWFFALGFGARQLAPVLARKEAWRAIDAVIALTMALAAVGLLVSAV